MISALLILMNRASKKINVPCHYQIDNITCHLCITWIMHELTRQLPSGSKKCHLQMLDLLIKTTTARSTFYRLQQKLNKLFRGERVIITAAENVAEKRVFRGSCAFCSAVKWSWNTAARSLSGANLININFIIADCCSSLALQKRSSSSPTWHTLMLFWL